MPVSVTHEGIDVVPADADPSTDWDGLLSRSADGTPFHRRTFLETVADHAGGDLALLVGYKGEQPVGLFPVFERTHGVVTTVFSPPAGTGMSQLGPVLLGLDGATTRTAETRTHRFVAGCLDWIDEAIDPTFVSIRTHARFRDYRPFGWNGFAQTPRYTYVVDLGPGPEDVMAGFSADARRNVRNTAESDYDITAGDGGGVDRIVSHLTERHEDRGVDYQLSAAFLHDLFERLPDGGIREYVCRVDGEYVGGLITLEGDDTVYRWQGGARPPRAVDVPVNDLLDWRVMTDAMDRGRTRYDLLGANTPELCEYKTKFGPTLQPYGYAEKGSLPMRLLSDLYRWFR